MDAVVDEPDLPADCFRGESAVSGDHQHADAGDAAAGDGLRHLQPGRIEHADKAEELEPLLELFGVGAARPQGRRGGPGQGRGARRAPSPRPRRQPREPAPRPAATEAQDDLGSALDVRDASFLREVHGRHALALGAERHLGQARADRRLLLVPKTPFSASTMSAPSVGSPEDRPAVLGLNEARVVAQKTRPQELGQRVRVHDAPVGEEAAERLVAGAFDLDRAPRASRCSAPSSRPSSASRSCRYRSRSSRRGSRPTKAAGRARAGAPSAAWRARG